MASAGVAELADAPGLGPGGLRLLEVQVLSPASPASRAARDARARRPAPARPESPPARPRPSGDSASRGVDLGHRLEERRRQAGGRLRRRDLAHLADEPLGLRRRDRDRPGRAVDLARERAVQVVEHLRRARRARARSAARARATPSSPCTSTPCTSSPPRRARPPRRRPARRSRPAPTRRALRRPVPRGRRASCSRRAAARPRSSRRRARARRREDRARSRGPSRARRRSSPRRAERRRCVRGGRGDRRRSRSSLVGRARSRARASDAATTVVEVGQRARAPPARRAPRSARCCPATVATTRCPARSVGGADGASHRSWADDPDRSSRPHDNPPDERDVAHERGRDRAVPDPPEPPRGATRPAGFEPATNGLEGRRSVH